MSESIPVSLTFDRRLGVLLGTFVGDALGMPFEGAPPLAAPEPLELEDARLGVGTYTDDTQMMIALAEVLRDFDDVDEAYVAQRFLDAYDARRGYGPGTTQVFALWQRGVPVDDAAGQIFRGGSFGNGAAMRIAPVGAHFSDDDEQLVQAARLSAKVTHAHPLGIEGAVILAAAIGGAIRGEDVLLAARCHAREPEFQRALAEVEVAVSERWPPGRVAGTLGSDASALGSVPAALVSALRATSFEEACTFAVRIGGDADTIGAMAGALAGGLFGASSIPARWLDGLENGEKGRDYVMRLAADLWAGYGP